MKHIKKRLRQFYEYIFGIKGILLSLYVIFILSADIFIVFANVSFELVIRTIVLVSFATILFCPYLLKKLSEKDFSTFLHTDVIIKGPYRFIIYFSISFFLFLIFFIAYYPGGFSPDSINQYQQATTSDYNDWHPVLHTLIVIKLPLILTNGWIGSIVLFQNIWFSIALAYMCLSVEKYINRKTS